MIPKEIEDDREERADRRLKPWSWDGYRSARVSHLFHHLSTTAILMENRDRETSCMAYACGSHPVSIIQQSVICL